MSIIFGYYSPSIKTYTPKELEAEHLLPPDVSIEVLQKVGHLFFIPVFPIEKLFVFRKDYKTYVLPHEIEMKIKAKDVLRTPIYSFALPILFLLGSILLTISGWVKDNNRIQKQKDYFMTRLPKMEYALSHLTPFHYIKLDNPSEYGNFGSVYLNFVEAKGDSLLFLKTDYQSSFSQNAAYRLMKHFQDNPNSLARVTIKKDLLAQALPRDFKKFHKKIRPAIPLLNDNKPYYIESIQYLHGPEIVYNGGSGFQSNSQIQYHLENIGFGATLTEVKNVEGLDFAMKNYGYVPGGYSKGSDNNINLVGDGETRDKPYAYLLIFIDSIGLEHTFSVKGKNFDISVDRVY